MRGQRECEQPGDLGLVGHQVVQQASKSHGVGGKFEPCVERTLRCVVPGGEDGVDDRRHRRQTIRQFVVGRNAIGDARDGDLLLRATDPLADRRLRLQKDRRDLTGVQPTQSAQRQSDPALDRQRRVTAREQQPQLVIAHHRVGGDLAHRRPVIEQRGTRLLRSSARLAS